MAVRNLFSIGMNKPIPIYVWIPPTYNAEYKITVERKDGAIDDITSVIFTGNITEGVTDQIGNFDFVIDNSAEQYSGVWTGDEILRFYSDYDLTATTLRFRGRIDKVSNQNNQIELVGRSEAVKILGINVTYAGTSETSLILQTLFNNYATDFTQNNINVSSVTSTVNWYQKPFLDCITELCNLSGFDFYIDCNLDVHYFLSGSIKNTTEAVVHDMNVFSIDDFGIDSSLVKNKVRVEGGNVGDFPVLFTVSSLDPNYGIDSTLGVRELMIKDQNIINSTQAEDRANTELILAINPRTIGEADCIGLATIQPGEQVRCSAPNSNLPPDYYTIVSYTHDFEGYMKTNLKISKEIKKLSTVIKDRILQESDISQVTNPLAMEFSWNFDFSTDSGTHSSTQISNGILSVTGATGGIWISDLNEISFNVAQVQPLINGTSLNSAKIWISTDGGIIYSQIYGDGASLTFPSGNKLRLRVDLVSGSEVESLALLYK